ncbi:putative inactive tRNA-specific adenosine deaminase-like protein 3 [Oratosquilla oratoria]|uniref:putative inactive tRNA-specific adenosine deaminase-like protein 3 n=1 Tax=Oratosquilla oratoria TaxID=337810 RepID=UPI003F7600C0
MGPALKKCKREETPGESKRFSGCVKVEAVVPLDVQGPIQLTQVVVAGIADKKQISKVIQLLSLHASVRELQHLKRVRKVAVDGKENVLVYIDYARKYGCLRESITSKNNLERLSDNETKAVKTLLEKSGISTEFFASDYYVSNVPVHPPKLRERYELSTAYWPCSFHEDMYLSQLVHSTLFTDKDKTDIMNYMNESFEVAKTGKMKGQREVGVVIVDPESNKILARVHDESSSHPLCHAVMMAIDQIAVLQGGGAWRHLHRKEYLPLGEAVNSSKANDEEEKALCDRTEPSFSGDIQGAGSKQAYICTGFNVFVNREPCMMCCMALLHSRVNRIFFSDLNQKEGALMSKTRLHTLSGINHRFEVFRVYEADRENL